MDLDLIERLLKLMDQSTAEELSVSENGVTIRISKRATGSLPLTSGTVQPAIAVSPSVAAPSPVSVAERKGAWQIRAGMTGIFYRAASPGAAPFVAVGQSVVDGQTLALLEAMKTFNPVECDGDGLIAEIHAEDGVMVEAGQPLFSLERA